MGVGSSCFYCKTNVFPAEYVPQAPELNARLHFGQNYQDDQIGMGTPKVHKDSVTQYTDWQAAKDPRFTSKTWEGLTSTEQGDCIQWWKERARAIEALPMAQWPNTPRRLGLVF
jgi:hypothetical protein